MSVKSGAAYLCAALLALSPTVAFAASADTQPSSTAAAVTPLAPGGAAGIRKAENWTDDNTVLIVGGVVIVAGAIALIASGNGHHHHSTSTTANP
ncbi:MAG TPA: hypothetical protein VG867_01105 [Rhizomicrobium sp.]|nr:hypothetical protein [Rhizomicrobium sp.]